MSEFDGYWDARGESKGRARRVAARLLMAVLAIAVVGAEEADGADAQRTISNWHNQPVSKPRRAGAPVSTPSFTANLRGNFVTASNTLLTCPDNPSAQRRRRARARGRRAAEQCTNRNNNDLNMRYINADPDGHFNSSTATLTMPAGARVVRAYLYWGADLARGVTTTPPPTARPAARSPTTRPRQDRTRAPTHSGRARS